MIAAQDALFLICVLLTGLAAFSLWVMLQMMRHYDRRIEVLEREVDRLRQGGGCLLLALVGSAATPPCYCRADAVRAAVADLRRLPPERQQRTRYLSLAHLPHAERGQWWKLLNFHANALSTEADVVVFRTLASGTIAALDVADYGWSPRTWDRLAAVEPYHYVKLQARQAAAPEPQWYRDQKTGEWFTKGPGGEWLTEAQTYAARKKEQEQVNALAPWLDTRAATELVNLTQAKAPIVRGDWFLWQTAVQADRNPGYYDFLGVKDQKDFFRLVGFSPELVKESKRRELLEAVAESTVTLQPRRLGRFPALDGFLYRTFDNRKALDERNPLRVLNGGFRFDASEEFGTLPNGLILWGLFNADGERQDTAPDFIASDATAHGTDRRVHVNLSCVRCHGAHDGVQPVDGWARNLFRGPLRLQSPDYEVLKKLRAQYLRDLQGPIEQDRRLYARAVAQATGGMKPTDVARTYGSLFAGYDAPVSTETAAAELGLTADEFRRKLTAYLKASGSVDTVLASFLSARGSVPREQWAEAYGTAATVLYGVQP